jgi:hypothetical protein
MAKSLACWMIAASLTLMTSEVALAADGIIEINQISALAGGVTPGDTPGFPVEIFVTGSYRLTGNLAVPSGAPAGIAVYAYGTTVDLAGFSITSSTQCSGTPVSCTTSGAGAAIDATGANDVAVENGRVAGFSVWGVALSEGSRAERLIVESNAIAGIFGDRNCSLMGNIVRHNGGPGIQVGPGSNLVANIVSGNKGVGATVGVSTGLAQNVFEGNAGGSVSGGRATEGNVCDDGRCSARGTRRFYLTPGQVTGAQARAACGAGFHMASFWELQDLSTLEYAPSPVGYSGVDTGSGPPNNPGWVRTGAASANPPNSCNAWTSTSGAGKSAALVEPSSVDPANNNSPWVVFTSNCSSPSPVWCVED